jgi:hypothetical protein
MGGVSTKALYDYAQEDVECVTAEHGDKGNIDYYNGTRNVLINPHYYAKDEADEGYWYYIFQWR